MRPAAFLFDLDGTLVDTESTWTRAIVTWLGDYGVSVKMGEVAPLVFGRSWPDIHAMLLATYPTLPRTTLSEAAAQVRPYYQRLATDPTTLVIPSAVTFLRQVARLAPCVIVSGSPHEDVAAAARLCGVAELLRFVMGAEDYARGKPAPDGFLAAAMKLDVDASECVVVEDSTAGVAAGRAAGMHVLGVDRNEVIHQNFAGCEWLVHDLSEIEVKSVFAP